MNITHQTIIAYFEWADDKLRNLLKGLPQDKFQTQVAGRSIQDLCIHVMSDYALLTEPLDPAEYDTFNQRLHDKSLTELFDYWKFLNHDFNKFKKKNAEDIIELEFANDIKMTLYQYLLSALQHGAHHRGQILNVYKNITGINKTVNIDFGNYMYL